VSGFRLRALAVQGAVDVELWGNVILNDEVYLPIVLRDG
jgi:hypothetical protein